MPVSLCPLPRFLLQESLTVPTSALYAPLLPPVSCCIVPYTESGSHFHNHRPLRRCRASPADGTEKSNGPLSAIIARTSLWGTVSIHRNVEQSNGLLSAIGGGHRIP